MQTAHLWCIQNPNANVSQFIRKAKTFVNELMCHMHKVSRIKASGKTCYISCNEWSASFLGHKTSYSALINSLYTYLRFWIYWLLLSLLFYQNTKTKIFLFLFRLGLRARSGTPTDVSIMVMAKSCLYQTQHSGLTITANGHICHGTKMGALSLCAACVGVIFIIHFPLHGLWFYEDKFAQQNKKLTGVISRAEDSFDE